MKETGIIMSGSYPQDVLEDRKTMTRRIRGLRKFNEHPDDWVVHHIVGADWEFKNIRTLEDYHILCPYGQVGDRLWVKEAYKLFSFAGVGKKEEIVLDYKAGGLSHVIPTYGLKPSPKIKQLFGWRSGRFMPRWASRITLEIEEIRAERLQRITGKDITKEGVLPEEYHFASGVCLREVYHPFVKLWDSLNAKRGYPWESNPWVWVIGFKKTVQS